jgi:hypothetical protein
LYKLAKYVVVGLPMLRWHPKVIYFMGVCETVMMGALDVPGLWRINKSFHAGVQVIQLGFFYLLPGIQAVQVQVVYCMLVTAQRGSVAQHALAGQ